MLFPVSGRPLFGFFDVSARVMRLHITKECISFLSGQSDQKIQTGNLRRNHEDKISCGVPADSYCYIHSGYFNENRTWIKEADYNYVKCNKCIENMKKAGL